MKTILILLMYLLMISNAAYPAAFYPQEGTGRTKNVENLLRLAQADQEEMMIDDMVFRVADLLRSGFTARRWTDGFVYYEFDTEVTSYQRSQWLTAARQWSDIADLVFVARTSEANYIHVFSGEGNWSYVGMTGGRQNMSIHSWNSIFTIAHEIGHALGLSHEHQRNDRDSYIAVNLDNVQIEERHNFIKEDTENYGDYDFDSVMHYDDCCFSIDCPPGYTCDCTHKVIFVLPPNQAWQDDIGQKSHLSSRDKAGMAARYGAPPIYVNSFATGSATGRICCPYHDLQSALNAAWAGAEIVIFGGTHAFAPTSISKEVRINSVFGAAIIK